MQSGQTKNGIGMTVSACLWLGLFPLLQFGTYTRITRDKWILMLILTGISLACFLTDLFRRRLSRPRMLPLLLGSGLLCWMLISCLASPYAAEVWWLGASSRREGLATQLCYMSLFFLFSFARVNRKPVLLSAAAGAVVFLVVVLLQRAGRNPFGLYPAGLSYETNPEFQGTIGNTDMDTGYLLLLAGLFVPALAKFVHPWEKLSAGIGMLAALYLIWTMGVQFGKLTLLALAAAVLFYLLPKKARLPVLILLLVLVLLTVWFWPGQSGGLWELHEILHGRTQLSFGSNRVAAWTYSLSLALSDRLFLGSGSDTFALRFNSYLALEGLEMPTRQGDVLLPHYFDNPHSEYIAQLINHGLPALLLFAALILSVFFSSASSLSWRCAVFCYAVQALLSFSVCLVAPMFWIVLGLAVSRPDRDSIVLRQRFSLGGV